MNAGIGNVKISSCPVGCNRNMHFLNEWKHLFCQFERSRNGQSDNEPRDENAAIAGSNGYNQFFIVHQIFPSSQYWTLYTINITFLIVIQSLKIDANNVPIQTI